MLGRGPIEDATTTKCDFTWKCGGPEAPIRPEGNLELSPAPLESKSNAMLLLANLFFQREKSFSVPFENGNFEDCAC